MISCDLIVAADNAKFGIPEVKRGLAAAAGGLMRLPRQIPTRLAMEILERNTDQDEIYIIGINNRGMELARRLVEGLRTISSAPIRMRT